MTVTLYNAIQTVGDPPPAGEGGSLEGETDSDISHFNINQLRYFSPLHCVESEHFNQ